MPQTEKVAISLPTNLLRKIEQSRKKTGETRSAFIRRYLENSFRKTEREKKIRAYIEGYEKNPETADEIAEAEATAEILSKEPW
jgi:metal-responsive CopG/Arc/MetJ family transcriptional regulator